MSLEDFHTKALRLVKEAEYPEGETQNRVLWDTIISGLASDKDQSQDHQGRQGCHTHQGHGDSLPRGLNPETPQQDAGDCKSQLCAVWEGIQKQEMQTKDQWQQWQCSGSSANAEECSGSNVNAGKPKSKGKKPPLPTDICWRWGKARHKKVRSARHLSWSAGIVESRDTMRKCAWRNQPTWWMFQAIPVMLHPSTLMNLENLFMSMHRHTVYRSMA